MMMSRMRGHGTKDDGFTLIELVMTVAIMGIIVVALVGVVIQYLKVTTSTETRLNESSDVALVSTYWQHDVSSLGVRGFNASSDANPVPAAQSVWTGVDPGGCGSSVSSSQPVVSFGWNGYTIGVTTPADAWNSTTQRVAYVAVPSSVSASDYVIQRVWCGAGTVPTLTVARHVTSWSVNCDGSTTCPTAGVPNVVTLTMHVQDTSAPTNTGAVSTGTDVTLIGERRQAS